MIYFALVARARDSLPLSESTDCPQNHKIRNGRKYMKTLLRKNVCFSERCVVKLEESLSIHAVKSVGVVYLLLCESSYPSVLVYSFLDEIQREFITTYETSRVKSAVRPYSFIEFDTLIQKTKQRYNNPRSLTTKLNLNNLGEEIKLRPPTTIPSSLLTSSDDYDHHFKYVDPIRQNRIDPVSQTAWLSVAVTTICAFFNLTRGVVFYNSSNWEGIDGKSPLSGMVFFVEAIIEVTQICLLLHHVKFKSMISAAIFALLCLCTFYQQRFKNNAQILTQLTCAVFITVCTCVRRVHGKPSHYTV